MENKRILQKEELEILKFIVNVCEDNNIRYYMQGGTFLGAIRHKGFIPWDDDADIGIPRRDYERFVKLIKKMKACKYDILTYEDVESDYNFVCKLHSKTVKVKEKNYNNNREYGIWVDIFPLDGLPNNKILRVITKYRLLFHRAMWKLSEEGTNINLEGNRKSFLDKVIIFFGLKLKLGKLFNKKKEIYKINKILSKNDFDSSNYVVNFMGAYKFKEMFKCEIYNSVEYYDFEDIKLPGPKEYDFYLKQIYGDYMKIPEKNEREVHLLEIINKGEK